MRSKTPLALMEQLVMVLVFALAAAMCVRMFSLSDRLSRHNEAVSQAALLAQNVAEEIKSRGGAFSEILDEGDWEYKEGIWIQKYDKNWDKIALGEVREPEYRIEVQAVETDVFGLLKANISVKKAEEELFAIKVAWQEVSGHE